MGLDLHTKYHVSTLDIPFCYSVIFGKKKEKRKAKTEMLLAIETELYVMYTHYLRKITPTNIYTEKSSIYL